MAGMGWTGRFATAVATITLAAAAVPSVTSAQTYLDARRMAMGGLFMMRDELVRYNVAYQAVPGGLADGKITIPIPVGLVQVLSESPTFDPQDSTFNAFEILDLVMNPPLYLELREATIPDSDIELFIGKNELQLDLHEAQAYIPDDNFTMGSSSRPLEVGYTFHGFRLGVSGFLQNELEVGLSDNLRAFFREAEPATPNTRYFMTGAGLVQTGFAFGAGYSLRALSGSSLGLTPLGYREDGANGIYVGAAVRYYQGVAFAQLGGESGMTTGDTIFGDAVLTDFTATVVRSDVNGVSQMGRGAGVDLGIALVSNDLTLGFGINDLGATLTWPSAIVELYTLDTLTNVVAKQTLGTGVEAKTELPVSYIVNGSIRIRGTRIGGDLVHSAGGLSIHVGAEQWRDWFALRGGVNRDNRGELQFGAGVGFWFRPVTLDIGLMTHSQSFSGERGIRLGTFVSIY